MVTTGLYGDPTSYFTDGVHPTRANQIIFNLCLLLVQIILLNLVIAVMGATYERVASQTIRQSLLMQGRQPQGMKKQQLRKTARRT